MDKRWLYRPWRRLPSSLQWAILWHSNAHFAAGVLALITDGQGRVLLLRHDYRRPGNGAAPMARPAPRQG